MKTYSFASALLLGLAFLMFPGCKQDTPKQGDKEEKEKAGPIVTDFTAFSSMEFPYIDEDGKKETITYYRNETVHEWVNEFLKNIPEDADPVEESSYKKLRKAFQKLYGKDTKQDVVGAVALLRELADVKKPYTPENWKFKELECHTTAKYILSLCYQDGVGVPKDKAKGLALAKEACLYDHFGFSDGRLGWDGSDLDDVAHPLACLEMSIRLLGGIDVSPNFVKGMYLLDGVEDRGNAAAERIQDKLSEIFPRDLSKLPEKFQIQDISSHEDMIRAFNAFEGLSVLDLTKMMARERK